MSNWENILKDWQKKELSLLKTYSSPRPLLKPEKIERGITIFKSERGGIRYEARCGARVVYSGPDLMEARKAREDGWK